MNIKKKDRDKDNEDEFCQHKWVYSNYNGRKDGIRNCSECGKVEVERRI